MIETIIRNYLVEAQDRPVLFEHLAGAGECYIIEKTGGSEENHIRSSTLAIQSYAGSKARAAELNEALLELMQQAVRMPEVSAVSINSTYDYTDTAMKAYRYQAVFDIVHY